MRQVGLTLRERQINKLFSRQRTMMCFNRHNMYKLRLLFPPPVLPHIPHCEALPSQPKIHRTEKLPSTRDSLNTCCSTTRTPKCERSWLWHYLCIGALHHLMFLDTKRNQLPKGHRGCEWMFVFILSNTTSFASFFFFLLALNSTRS